MVGGKRTGSMAWRTMKGDGWITKKDNTRFFQMFTLEEVLSAFCQISRNKVPGIDDLSVGTCSEPIIKQFPGNMVLFSFSSQDLRFSDKTDSSLVSTNSNYSSFAKMTNNSTMESSPNEDDMDFQFFYFDDVEFLNNVNNIMADNNHQNETASIFSKEISSGDYTFGEASNVPKAPVNDLHLHLLFFLTDGDMEFRSSLTRDDQPQLDRMNASPDTLGFENVSHNGSNPLHAQVDQLLLSPARTNESILQQSSSNPNQIYSGFEGNGSSFGRGDAYQTASPLFNPLIMERTNSFPLALAEKLPENSGHSTQPFQTEQGLNSIQTDQFNDRTGSTKELPQNRGYSTQPLHSEHGVNLVQTNQVNGRIGMAENLSQNKSYTTQPFHSEHVINSIQTNQVNGDTELMKNLSKNRDYTTTQPFHSEHVFSSIQKNQVNGDTGLTGNISQNRGYTTQPFHSEHVVNSIQINQVNGDTGLIENLSQNRGYKTQPFHSEHVVNSIQTSQVNGDIGPTENLSQNKNYTTQSFHSEHVVNSVQTNQVNGDTGLTETLPQNGSYSTQPFQSQQVNSIQINQVNDHIGSSLQAELQGVESSNLGKVTMWDNQVQQNNNFNNSHQGLPYSNSFTQNSNETGYLNGGSEQINQQAPNGVSYKDNDFYRPLAPPGQQFVQFQATGNSDPQRYNFVSLRPSAPLRY
ncbi:GATA zinc finger domain-containing protein 14-like [Hibiscus syriacus]|uniref:GATA zinc finger domain-containing protein 14-like n=1 Tax=Hibiscus syriacus TaxID=106335 RepID=UPI0019227673|nr:GATA zinc finger domain-containing protein 14-like [Hibiscus syriacus]